MHTLDTYSLRLTLAGSVAQPLLAQTVDSGARRCAATATHERLLLFLSCHVPPGRCVGGV